MKRRTFLKSSLILAGAMCLDVKSFAKVLNGKGEPNLRIGVLSDIHITDADSAKVFVHTLEYFRDKNVDGVMIAGDMADWGWESQLQTVADAWYRVFPKDKAPDGHRVEKLFIYGNHDVNDWSKGKDLSVDEKEFKEAIFLHREETWKRCFKEKYSPVYMKTIKGYHFIGTHWIDGRNVPGLEEFLAANRGKLAGGKPFFYFQHPHPKDTCNGPWAWGQDDGTVTKLLSQFPNCFAFSGHSHSPLNDERDLWQGAFTSIGTASLSYQYPMGGRENSYVDGAPEIPSQMPWMQCKDGKHGMLMSVYDDCIALERREFLYDQPLGDNWIISLPVNASEAPLSFENRARTALVPRFGKEDRVTITRGTGKDRYGVEQKQVTIHFPSVLRKRTGVRAFDYEIQVEANYMDTTYIALTKRVFSPHCYLGENQDEDEVVCVFGENELPIHREVRFVVRPCECFGKKGDPIYSDWVPARES